MQQHQQVPTKTFVSVLYISCLNYLFFFSKQLPTTEEVIGWNPVLKEPTSPCPTRLFPSFIFPCSPLHPPDLFQGISPTLECVLEAAGERNRWSLALVEVCMLTFAQASVGCNPQSCLKNSVNSVRTFDILFTKMCMLKTCQPLSDSQKVSDQC